VGCDCATHPKAGLVKSARFIRSMHAEPNTILLDAGDFFGVEDPRLAGEIADAYSSLGYDLVCIGDREFSSGLDALAQVSKKIRLASGNLGLPRSLVAVAGGPIVKSAGSFRIGIIPLIGRESVLYLPNKEEQAAVDIRDPLQEAKKELALIKSLKVDFIVLVYHGEREICAAMLERLSDVDVCILAHSQELIEGLRVGSAFLVSPGEEGNRVGEILVVFKTDGKHIVTNSFRYFKTDIDPDDKDIRMRADAYFKKLKAE
jgi:2',3'-cyclic-nucleotide 2'-phosphodiesterase (5'-nucleotidase family)